MEDLILQPARQTLVSLAKDGQLLRIPDEVRASVSGKNKRVVDVAPVEAKTSGFDNCWNFPPSSNSPP